MLLRWLINGLGLYAAVRLMPGVHAVGDWRTFAIVAAIFGLVNALMLWLTGWLATEFGVGFHIAGFWPAFRGALVISLVNLVSSLLTEGEEG